MTGTLKVPVILFLILSNQAAQRVGGATAMRWDSLERGSSYEMLLFLKCQLVRHVLQQGCLPASAAVTGFFFHVFMLNT